MKQVPMIVCALLSLFGACTLTAWMNASPKVVSADMSRIKGQFIAQLAQHAASSETVAKASTRFNQKLRLVLESYAQSTKAVILDRQFVLFGAEDVTQDITVLLAAAMGGAK